MLRGLYAIADTGRIGEPGFAAAVDAALAGGAAMIQYRDKSDDRERRVHQAGVVARLCRAYGATAIINDDIALALEVGAHGVHVGRDDAAIEAARLGLGPGAVIGVSCYAEIERARDAVARGASYVAFGSMYPSSTKPAAVHAPLALLGQARAELEVPICAIGGITAERAAEVIAAGADLTAVIDDLFGAADVRARARAYAEAFARAGATL